MADKHNPDTTPEEGDVKVPIDDAKDEAKAEAAQAAAAEPAAEEAAPSGVESEIPGYADMTPEEQAKVKAAYESADKNVEADFKANAEKLRAERDELQKQLDGLSAEVEKAKKSAAESADQLVRLQADWQNYRRRTAQERLDEKARAAEKLVLSLLPVIDDMERAVDHASQTAGDNDQLRQFVDGVVQVHDKMVGVLGKEGVEVIDPAGQAFNPLEHQAVGRAENKDVYDETVDQVYQKGYRMGGKVIRTAMVTVTYGGPKRPAEDAGADAEPDKADGAPTGEAK